MFPQTCFQIIQHDNLMVCLQQSACQMRANKAGSTGY